MSRTQQEATKRRVISDLEILVKPQRGSADCPLSCQTIPSLVTTSGCPVGWAGCDAMRPRSNSSWRARPKLSRVSQGPVGRTTEWPCPQQTDPSLSREVPPPGWVPVTGPEAPNLVLSRRGFSALPAHKLVTQGNRDLPRGPGIPRPLVTGKPAPTACSVPSALGCDFHAPLWGTQPRGAPTPVTNTPVSVPSVQGRGRVFAYLVSHGMGDAPSNRVIGAGLDASQRDSELTLGPGGPLGP